MSDATSDPTVYDRLLKWVFSGQVPPGAKLVERQLAAQFGVSRIPVRESVREMLAQGVLVGGEKWEGARTRSYTPNEVRQLSEYRQILEGGAARLAAEYATDDDLARLTDICRQESAEVGNYGSDRWAELDHEFHDAIVAASHNDRLIHVMHHLLAECHFVFYVWPRLHRKEARSAAETEAHMARVVEDHRTIIDLIGAGDGEAAARIAQAHIRTTGRQAARSLAE